MLYGLLKNNSDTDKQIQQHNKNSYEHTHVLQAYTHFKRKLVIVSFLDVLSKKTVSISKFICDAIFIGTCLCYLSSCCL